MSTTQLGALDNEWAQREFLTAVAVVAGIPLDGDGFVPIVNGAVEPALTLVSHVQPGTFDARVLLTTDVWFDWTGRAHLLEEMSPQHRIAVIAMLAAMSGDLVLVPMLRVAFELMTEGAQPRLVREHQLLGLLIHDEQWIRRTPLVRRLLELSDAGWHRADAPGGLS